MSAYKSLSCSFKDLTTLLDSLKNLGYDPVTYKEKQNLRGYTGDVRNEKAEIIVPKSQISPVSNDLGFSYDEDTNEYKMICSEYDLHKGLGDKVKQTYALVAIKSALRKNKFSFNDEVYNKDQSVTITAGKII
jgi:hypothetical protein